jgi:hypothetical protein
MKMKITNLEAITAILFHKLPTYCNQISKSYYQKKLKKLAKGFRGSVKTKQKTQNVNRSISHASQAPYIKCAPSTALAGILEKKNKIEY